MKMSGRRVIPLCCGAAANCDEASEKLAVWPGSTAETQAVKAKVNSTTIPTVGNVRDNMFQLQPGILRWKIRLFTF
jgi:hypothetical protein